MAKWCAMMLAALLLGVGQAPSAYARLDVSPLPSDTDVDYQLGGDAPPPDNVGIVVRDRTSDPVEGRYNICYVNGYQTQDNEKKFWKQHWSLVLKDRDGRPVVDANWGEWLLDLRTPAKRSALAEIVGGWAGQCADDGFDAVDFDNLDSFTRSEGLLTRKQALAFARLLIDASHTAGLAVGQKNLVGFDGTRIGFDYAVSESCSRYDECGGYIEHFGDQVLMIEYRRQDFDESCEAYGDQVPVVLRDPSLSPDGVHDWC